MIRYCIGVVRSSEKPSQSPEQPNRSEQEEGREGVEEGVRGEVGSRGRRDGRIRRYLEELHFQS